MNTEKFSCKSCGNDQENDFKFCPACGAKRDIPRLSVFSILSELFYSITNLEAPIWQTIKDLTIHPHKVTHGYITGVRKQYINPSRYLLISFTITGILFLLSSEKLDMVYEKTFKSGFNAGSQVKSTDDEKIASFQEKMDSVLKVYQKNTNLIGFSMIPILALFSIAFLNKRKRYNYAEHFVVNAYVYSHSSIIMSLFGIGLLAIPNIGFNYWLWGTSILSILLGMWWLTKSLKRPLYLSFITYIISYIAFMFVIAILFVGALLIYTLELKN